MEIEDDAVSLPSFSQFIRGVGALLGLGMVILGVIYTTRIFGWVSAALQNPESIEGLIQRWETAISGGAQTVWRFGDNEIPVSSFLAVLVLGFGVFILIRIAFWFLTEGAKVISSSIGEKEAIKSILLYVFGQSSGKIPPHIEDPSSVKATSAKNLK